MNEDSDFDFDTEFYNYFNTDPYPTEDYTPGILFESAEYNPLHEF